MKINPINIRRFETYLLMQDNNGQTPLHFAAKFGHQQIVTNIISWCKQAINISDKQQVTPFVQAVVSGHFDVSQRNVYKTHKKDFKSIYRL